MALAVVGCVVAGVSAAAAAEPQADETVRAQASTWDKPALSIQTGDRVTWNFDSGDGLSHNLNGVTGPAEDPAWPQVFTFPTSSGTYQYTFTQPGTYTFVCDVHAATMRGTLTVTGAPATPTATATATSTATTSPTATPTPTPTRTASPQPTARPSSTDDRTTPAPSRSSAGDTTRPAISKLRLKGVRRGARVNFTLSEPAAVTIRFRRGKTTVRTVRLSARAGTRAVTVRSSRLVRGRYTVEIEARDARGNRADVQRKKVRVTR